MFFCNFSDRLMKALMKYHFTPKVLQALLLPKMQDIKRTAVYVILQAFDNAAD